MGSHSSVPVRPHQHALHREKEASSDGRSSTASPRRSPEQPERVGVPNIGRVAAEYVASVFPVASREQRLHAVHCLMAYTGQTAPDLLFAGAPLPGPIAALVAERKVSHRRLLSVLSDERFDPRLRVARSEAGLTFESVLPCGQTVDLLKLLGDTAAAHVLGALIPELKRRRKLDLFAKEPGSLGDWQELHARLL